jgi:hypothetical protein
MQTRSSRGSGEPVWVIAFPSACERLGPDPRRALGPAAIRAASTGRTRDRTRPILQQRQKVLATAPSTRDPKRALAVFAISPLAEVVGAVVEKLSFRLSRKLAALPRLSA